MYQEHLNIFTTCVGFACFALIKVTKRSIDKDFGTQYSLYLSPIFTQNLCLKVFRSNHPYPGWHLQDPPESIKPQLEELLEQCATAGSPHIPKDLLEKLRRLLQSSIDL